MTIIYCESCEKEMKEDKGICDECVSNIQRGLIDPPEGW